MRLVSPNGMRPLLSGGSSVLACILHLFMVDDGRYE